MIELDRAALTFRPHGLSAALPTAFKPGSSSRPWSTMLDEPIDLRQDALALRSPASPSVHVSRQPCQKPSRPIRTTRRVLPYLNEVAIELNQAALALRPLGLSAALPIAFKPGFSSRPLSQPSHFELAFSLILKWPP
jgi:hypothetical protein